MENLLQLTYDEMSILESVYGRQTSGGNVYNPRNLEDIKFLNAREQNFF